MSKFSFHASLRERGRWWLPSNDQKEIDGFLIYSPENGLKLELMGSFFDFAASMRGSGDQPDFIQGQLDNGEVVTLYKTFRTHISSNLGTDRGDTHYYVQFAFFGKIFGTAKELRFRSISLHFHEIEAWFASSNFISQTDYHKNNKIGFEFHKPPEIKVPISKIKARLESHTTVTSTGLMPHITKASIDHKRWLEIDASRRNKLEWFLARTTDLDIFLFLLTMEHQDLEMAYLKEKASKKSKPIYILYKRTRRVDRAALHSYTVPFPLPLIETTLGKKLNTWHTLLEKVGTQVRLFYSADLGNQGFDQFQFLAVVQALESYHRNMYRRPKNYHFKKRIRDLFDRLSKPTRDVFLTKRSRKLLTIITDSRNYYTHYDKRKEKKALVGADLFYLTMKLRLLFVILSLRKLGFTEDEIVKRIVQHQQTAFWFRRDLKFL